jgi:Zn-dependent protease
MLFGGDFLERMPYLLGALIPALTFHEWGHGYMAHRFGDDTAKNAGRLSLNPFVHLDPIGTIAIFLIGFGWARPVPVNPRLYRNHWGNFWVPFAGPLMNIILAFAFAMLLNFKGYLIAGPESAQMLINFFQISLFLNLALCFFNLIPIGPLDGSYILTHFLPYGTSFKFTQWNARHGSMFLFGAIILDSFTNIGIIRLVIFTPVQIAAKLLLFAV